MDEKVLERYENLFNIKKERIEELINEFAKEGIEGILRDELHNEYLIEIIYRVGKTEDERLFLAYLVGGMTQRVRATMMMSELQDALIRRISDFFANNMQLYVQLRDAFWEELANYLGTPDLDKILEKDRNFEEKLYFAKKKLMDELKKWREENDEQI